eukprot:625662-Ditylum_brightwellii.AAC.1
MVKVNHNVFGEDSDEGPVELPVAKKARKSKTKSVSDEGPAELHVAKKAHKPKTKSESWLFLIEQSCNLDHLEEDGVKSYIEKFNVFLSLKSAEVGHFLQDYVGAKLMSKL